MSFLICGSGSVVERCLAKANVASSNLVSRSIFFYQKRESVVPQPSGKAKVCNTFMPQFKSGWYLQTKEHCESSAFLFGNEAHLRCMKNEAGLRLMKRALAHGEVSVRFASWRQRRRFTEAVRLLLHIRQRRMLH